MSTVHRLLLLATLIASVTVASCDTQPTGPGTGSGNLLEANVGGTALSFTLSENFQSYDEVAKFGRIGGTSISGATSQTITATFVTDLDVGTYPRALTGSAVTISYVILENGVVKDSYDCIEHPDRCAITLTSRNGQIVDGTFAARLTNRNDTTKHIEITNGVFSAKLE